MAQDGVGSTPTRPPSTGSRRTTNNSCHAGQVHDPAGDLITLVVPADTAYSRIARIAAAAIAVRRGFSFAEVHDLRLAMDEAMILLLGEQAHTGSIRISFRVDTDRVVVEAVTEYDEATTLNPSAIDRFVTLVDGMLSSYEIEPAPARVRLTMQRR